MFFKIDKSEIITINMPPTSVAGASADCHVGVFYLGEGHCGGFFSA